VRGERNYRNFSPGAGIVNVTVITSFGFSGLIFQYSIAKLCNYPIFRIGFCFKMLDKQIQGVN